MRCIARFLHEEKWIDRPCFQLETKAGVYPVRIENYDNIQITLPMDHRQKNQQTVSLPHGVTLEVTIVSTGNLHAIVKVTELDNIAVEKLGAEIAFNLGLTQGVNVGFMEILNENQVRLRTFERGVGETHACGSNAVAAAVAGMAQGLLHNPVKVTFRYGSLIIEQHDHDIVMTGPASRVFCGEMIID